MTTQTHLLRLVYASRATFSAGSDIAGVSSDMARILMQSRRNNPAKGLVGALYFADGCFFQCLEGPADAVDALYARLHDDPRHRDLEVLGRAVIERMSFAGWSMKFVPNAAAVRALLRRHGMASFDPYRMSPVAIADMVQLLVEGAADGAAEGADAPVASATPSSRQPTDSSLAIARQARVLAGAALAVAVAGLGVALLR